MRVLGLYGSPRKGGNTDILLDEFLRGCEQSGATCERIRLTRLQVGGCKGCGDATQAAADDKNLGLFFS